MLVITCKTTWCHNLRAPLMKKEIYREIWRGDSWKVDTWKSEKAMGGKNGHIPCWADLGGNLPLCQLLILKLTGCFVWKLKLFSFKSNNDKLLDCVIYILIF
jgi:hypothetical protein